MASQAIEGIADGEELSSGRRRISIRSRFARLFTLFASLRCKSRVSAGTLEWALRRKLTYELFRVA